MEKRGRESQALSPKQARPARGLSLLPGGGAAAQASQLGSKSAPGIFLSAAPGTPFNLKNNTAR